MNVTGILLIAFCWFSLSLFPPAHAQRQGSQHEAAGILNNLPSDVLAKVQALAQILQQGLKDGKISDIDIQQGVTSGQLGEKLKQLSPEAARLLEEITDASRQGRGPGEESLIPLMGGLSVSPP